MSGVLRPSGSLWPALNTGDRTFSGGVPASFDFLEDLCPDILSEKNWEENKVSSQILFQRLTNKHLKKISLEQGALR